MIEASNRKLWIIGVVASLSLFFELVVIGGMFNSPPATSLHRYAFRWNVVCAVLAPIALVLGMTLNEKRLRAAVFLGLVVITGPLFVFVLMNPSHPISCFIESYKVSPVGTLGGFAFVFVPLVVASAFLFTLYQRSRNVRSLGASSWPH